jgi:hypothetical protein
VKLSVVVATASLAGFLGGALATRILPTSTERRADTVVRARSFEMVDEAGHVISFWGIDKKHYPVLAFRSAEPPFETPVSEERSAGLDDPLNQRTAIGVIGNRPFLLFRVTDGTTRMGLTLTSWGKPVLLMEDETGPRVRLGLHGSDTPGPEDNDWALSFNPRMASIGMFVRLDDGEKRLQGFTFVRKESVKYPDVQGK